MIQSLVGISDPVWWLFYLLISEKDGAKTSVKEREKT